MPPVWPTSDWRMSMAWCWRYGSTSQMVRSRSPVAMGMRICCLSFLNTSMLPGTAGSSIHITSYGSRAEQSWINSGGGTAQWASNITAPSGPTRLRASATLSHPQFWRRPERRRFLPQVLGHTRVGSDTTLVPARGGTAMRRLQAITWVITVCADLRKSQAKTLAHLVAASLHVGRASLAALGRQLAGPAQAKHKIKRAWRFIDNRRVTVSDAMRGPIARLCKRRKKP